MATGSPDAVALDSILRICQIRAARRVAEADWSNPRQRVAWGNVMATQKAPAESAEDGAPGGARRLWQAPVFVLGAVALAAVLLLQPISAESTSRQLEHHLSLLRHQLGRADSDAQALLLLASRTVEEAASFPDRLGEAEFLLGSAHLRSAERLKGGQAAEHWHSARHYLEEAERHGVPPDDHVRLQYRLGKVGFHTNDDPQRVADRLAESAEQADDRAEAYTLLTQAYLRLPQPNLQKAFEANDTLRNKVPLLGEDVLAPARLLGGDLLLRLGKPQEARKVLEKVGEQAPPRILAQARILRGRTYQEEGKWSEAATLFQEALADSREPLQEPTPVLYNLGLCYRQLEQTADSIRVWEESLRDGRGDEAAAAALQLAELHLHGATPEKALQTLTAAVDKVHQPSDWTNTLIDLSKAREPFERACETFRKMGRFDLALDLIPSYQRLAAPGRAQVLHAEVAAEWGRQRQVYARQAKEKDDQQKEERAARELLAKAAAAYAEAAALDATPTEQADHLWLSATAWMDCQDYSRAAEEMQQFLSKGQRPERQGEGWYLQGEAYRQANKKAAAESAYRECIKFPTHFAYRARYQLALAAIDKGDLDEAEAALSLNLKLLRFDSDAEAQKQTLFALGDLLYQRHNYRMVVRYLDEALSRSFPVNPEGPATAEATRARYQLADSYRQLAAQQNQNLIIGEKLSNPARAKFQEEHRGLLEKAAEEFHKLDEYLKKPEAQGHLSLELQVQVPFIEARCRFDGGFYDEALKVYSSLAQRYPNRPEGLDALVGCVHCYAAVGDLKAVRHYLEEIRAALPAMDESIRKPWEEWLIDANKRVGN
jgi:tetratricopeptide (TPR) repeat protein